MHQKSDKESLAKSVAKSPKVKSTAPKKKVQPADEIDSIFEDILSEEPTPKITKEQKVLMVTLKAFTGMNLGQYPVLPSHSDTTDVITIQTQKGILKFNAKTKLQLKAKNPKFANRIEF